MLQEVIRHMLDPRFFGKIFFIEDYNLAVSRLMVQGCDVWLNTPRRPYEACGTSGQKVPVNAGVNLSISDGWWCEGYNGENGWTIGPPSPVNICAGNRAIMTTPGSCTPFWKKRSCRCISSAISKGCPTTGF